MLNKQREWSEVTKQIYGVTFCRCGICSLGEILPPTPERVLGSLVAFLFPLKAAFGRQIQAQFSSQCPDTHVLALSRAWPELSWGGSVDAG